MTIKELKEKLNSFSDNDEVVIMIDEFYRYYNIDKIRNAVCKDTPYINTFDTVIIQC